MYSKRVNLFFLISLLFLLIFSCAPQTKESYLEDFKEFMNEVEQNHSSYTEKDWLSIDKKYEKFTNEWYKKFEDDFTWKEQLIIGKYQIQYNMYRVGDESKKMIHELFGQDIDDIKKQLKYYKEHQMDKDIKEVMKQAKSISKEAEKTVKEILEELDIDLDKLKDE